MAGRPGQIFGYFLTKPETLYGYRPSRSRLLLILTNANSHAHTHVHNAMPRYKRQMQEWLETEILTKSTAYCFGENKKEKQTHQKIEKLKTKEAAACGSVQPSVCPTIRK